MSIIPNYVPSPYKTINVSIRVKDAEKAIHFYNAAFGAEEVMRLTRPEGTIAHAEVKITDTIVMLTEDPALDESIPSRVVIQLYTGDVETLIESAVDAGARLIEAVEVKFYGDRVGRILDPFGIEWAISTHMEDVTAAQVQKRFNDLYA